MCFTSSDRDPDIEFYRVHRNEDTGPNDPPIHHDRRRSSVQGHLDTVPTPITVRRNRYPKVHHNTEQHFRTNKQLYEAPTKRYPYHSQNARGMAFDTSPHGTRRRVDPGYERTIFDENVNLEGVVYHPPGNRNYHVRAEEYYRDRRGREKRIVPRN